MKDFSKKLGIVPLLFHRIVTTKSLEWEDVSEALFRQILDHIGNRWTIFSNKTYVDDAKWLLTFDDGWSSDYEVAFPILLEAEIRATFFLITSFVDQPGYVTWEQVREMHKYGMSFGSHSSSHRRLTEISSTKARQEMENSKQHLEDKLGIQINEFSFPFGAWTPELRDQALTIGYTNLCVSDHGVIQKNSNIIPRNSIHSAMQWSDVRKIMHPTTLTRLNWHMEDRLKKMLKNLVGHNRYIQIRSYWFK